MADFREFYTTEGNRLDNIAWDFYDNPYDYGDIIKNNFLELFSISETGGVIDDILTVEKGLPGNLRLLIPVKEETETESEVLPPWES